ncbi:hypothetical protein U8607_11350 [Methylobacterium durans]|uniref:hypothetical protein n=1 Tax=Methylobacterium durans TaxID=2202825 RepID=UPI002AFFBBB5|nr:hypothetical protein [Methylobacterium durans]MEA1832677.1 hypothetical protein [Methylobacterium durans]
MTFTVTSDKADDKADPSRAENYLRPADAYRRARECEQSGLAVTIRLPTGDDVTPEEFRELYLLKDAD